MTPDIPSFLQPPGQSTIRFVDNGDAPTLTNVPSAESVREQLRPLGDMADFVIRARPVVARAGSCLGSLWMAWGYLALAFGILFIGGMFVAIVLFNKPLILNGAPAGKLEGAGFLAGFLLAWVAICGVWIWMSRQMRFNRDQLDRQWRLSLGPDVWIARRACVSQIIGRCRPVEIDRLSVSPTWRVVARLASGKTVPLSGPLPPFDAAWLRDALMEMLGHSVAPGEPAFPFVPAAEPAPRAGTNLPHRLTCTDSPWKSLAGVAALNLFWNGITGVFVYQAFWGEPRIQWVMALFLIPFGLVGLVLMILLGFVVYHFAVHLRIRRTTIELSEFPLRTGSRVAAFVSQPGRLPLRRLTVRLACDEEAECRAGTTTSTDTKRVRLIDVFEQTEIAADHDRPFAAGFEFDIPGDAMHSFAGEHNRIRWSLIVAGEFHGWPGFERQFSLVVHPCDSGKGPIA
jgi:hypothetical protein